MKVECPYCGSKDVYPLPDEIRLCCVFNSCHSTRDLKTVKDIGDDILQKLQWEFKCKECGKTFYLVWRLSEIIKHAIS